MPTSVLREVRQPDGLGRLWWLPANGHGNGLDDHAWTPIVDTDADTADRLLTALSRMRVPAYAAPLPVLSAHHRPRGADEPGCRVWVGSSSYGRAEWILLAMLPNLPGGESHAGR